MTDPTLNFKGAEKLFKGLFCGLDTKGRGQTPAGGELEKSPHQSRSC